MKKLRNIKYSNEGAAGLVVAILLIGLFISVITIVQTVFVPQWMKQKEAEHMELVANQFTQLKSSIDTLSISNDPHKLVSNTFTLGNKELPFFSSSRSYGALNFNSNDYKIVLEDDKGNHNYSLGSFQYSSQNAYYLDQSYVLENGALILSQRSGDIVLVNPSIFLTETNDLVINLVMLTENGKKTSATGYGTYPVQARLYDNTEEIDDIFYVTNITIISSYKQAWKNFFNDSLPHDKFNFTIVNTDNNDGIKIQFNNNYPNVYVYLTKIEIQIGPGWVE